MGRSGHCPEGWRALGAERAVTEERLAVHVLRTGFDPDGLGLGTGHDRG